MLYLRGLNGLGVNPFVTAAANTALIHQGGNAGAASSHAGGFSITEHHWWQVFDENNPGIRTGSGVDRTEYLARFGNAVRALTATLPQCDPTAVTDNGTTCYFGRFVPLTSWHSTPDEVGLLPPGVFAVHAVPFGAHEMQNGRFTRTFVPSAQQRRELEWAVIYGSQKRLFGSHGVRTNDRPLFGDSVITNCVQTAMRSNPALDRRVGTNPSVDEILGVCPDVMLFSVNFSRNPIQPTSVERANAGGWKSWIARGGYPLSRAIITGQSPTSNALGIQFCEGFECACPSIGQNAGFPACVPASFNKDGVGAKPSEGSFYPYVAVPQDVVKNELQLSLVHNDPSWITRFGNAGAAFMQALAMATCANQGFTKEYLQNQMKPKFLDASGKVCVKGTPGCKEIGSSTTSQVGVGIFNGAMELWCAGWAGDNLPDPMATLPPVAPIPTPPPTPKIWWWAVVAAGFVGGAAAFSRRSG